MSNNKITIVINDELNLKVSPGISIFEIINYYRKYTKKNILGAKINNIFVDYDKKINKDTKITLFDYYDNAGNIIYQSGLKFVLILAVKKLWNKSVSFKYSLDKGTYVEVGRKITDNDIINLKIEMEKIVSYDFRFNRQVINRREAINYYLKNKEVEKAGNILNIPNNFVELYEVHNTYCYFYSQMPYSTGFLNVFDIIKISDRGFVLMYPKIGQKRKIPYFSL